MPQTVVHRDVAGVAHDQARSDRNQDAAQRGRDQSNTDSGTRRAEADRGSTVQRGMTRDEQRPVPIDPLTGALGRAHGTMVLGREINRARHGNGKLVLAFVDVDGLKDVNDGGGHAAGDLLLRQVVAAIQKHLRSYDPVTRVGGDEFICALIDATAEDARSRFEEIQATLSRAQPGASLSFGLAELRPEDSLHELTARGRAAVDESKQRRRHTTTAAGGPPSADTSALTAPAQARGSALPGSDVRWRRFGDALRAGDPDLAWKSVAEALRIGLSVTAIYDRVVAPAMRWIGELWRSGAVTVADEHLASAICQDVLARLYPRMLTTSPASRERIVLAAVEGEHHILGLRMGADTLEGAGFKVLYLGANVSLSALLEACRTYTPVAVGLSVTMALNLPTLIGEIQALLELDSPPTIFAAGPAAIRAIEQGLNLPVIDGVQQIVDTLDSLLAQPQQVIVPATLAASVTVAIGAGEFNTTGSSSRDEAFARTTVSAADAARDAARRAFVTGPRSWVHLL